MKSPQIPGFEIQQQVRASSSSTTWKALQRTLERDVLIRILHPDATEQQRNAFESTARAFACIKHPNLIQVFDVAREDQGNPYLVLEAVEGDTLAELLQRETTVDPVRAAKIGIGIADALDAAWKQASLIHRNLKPENLCLTPEGIVKIVDFGAATLIQPGVDTLESDGGLIVGTPQYMAPEQAQGLQTLDFHADMYGLGALLYHLITGAAPFAEEPDAHRRMTLQITGTLPSPREKNPKIPAGVDVVLGRLLMKDPHARYDWWQDAVADLQRLSLGRAIPRDKGADPDSVRTLVPYVPPHRRKHASVAPETEASPAEAIRPPEQETPPGPPALVRAVLWILLAAGLSVLGILRWDQEDRPAPAPAPSPTAPATAADPALFPEPVAPAQPDPTHSTAPSPEAAPSDPPPSSATVPAVPSAPSPAISDVLPDALLQGVAEALGRGDIAAARALLEAGATPREGAGSHRQEALRALAAVGNPNDLVGSLLVDRYRDRTLRIEHRGRNLSVLPERYAAGLLSVKLLRDDGTSNPWSLDLATLDIAERLRLLGPGFTPRQDHPTDEIAYALLILQAGDRAGARRMADRVPALAPFLSRLANR